MSPKKSKRKRPTGEKKVLLAFRQAARPLLIKELKELLAVEPHQDAWVADTVANLVQRGDLVHLEGGRYGLTEEMNLVAGELSVHPDGYGFATPEGGGKDIYISAANLKEAWHGDRVVVRLEGRRGRHREGKVIRIIERKLTHVVGLLNQAEDTFYLEPEDERLLFNLVIPEDKLLGAQPGQVVQARVTHYPTAHLNPKGEVVEVLGAAEDAEVQTLLVIAKYLLPHRFPPQVLAAANQVPAALDDSVLGGREDMRDLNFVTIDGEDARDFDDGVCVVKKRGGFFTLFVAIADVSHYVAPGSPLDQEAHERGTSVYFPHRAVHMLPERLSTAICSLKPDEDRLAVAAILEYDRQGNLRRSRFTRAVIRSRARLTYRLVHRLLTEKDRGLREKYGPFLKMLGQMADLTVLLRERRGERGSLLMSIPEAEVILDDRGWPVDVRRVDHLLSHQIIEEFMIAANEAVGEFLGEPSLFRVHDNPDPVKLATFRTFVRSLGLALPPGANRDPRVLRNFLLEVQATPYAAMVQIMLLRSLKQAIYSGENRGHYGLAVQFYTHFTSPIRRYPDLLVHRLLLAKLAKKKPPHSLAPDDLEAEAKYLSQRERRAIEAEREMLARMQVRCLAHRLGEIFTGRITSVTAFGFFVALDDLYADGLVRLVDLPDDYYKFDEARQRLVGRRYHKTFQLGDAVTVRVAKVDVKRRHVSLEMVGEGGEDYAAEENGKEKRREWKGRPRGKRSAPKTQRDQ